jgi:phage-related protein
VAFVNPRRRWRLYKTDSGRSPVREFLSDLTPLEREEVWSVMAAVAQVGFALARHLRGDIYEVRVAFGGKAFRILFAAEGQKSQILLAVQAFEKKTNRTPARLIDLAEDRLIDWRSRARPRALR